MTIARKPGRRGTTSETIARSNASAPASLGLNASPDDLLMAALQRGDDSMATGRHVVTFSGGRADAAAQMLSHSGLRVADARDFDHQLVRIAEVGDADALMFPEIGVALVADGAAGGERLAALSSMGASAGRVIEPEYFAFASNAEYLRGFLAAATAIAQDLRSEQAPDEATVEEIAATWGLLRCRVPQSRWDGRGITIAVLDTGFDLGHPDFAGRQVVDQSFVAQPVQDLHGHGTHCIGTACGPLSPAGSTPRYGIAHAARILAGKVLTNSGSGATGSIVAGMNWAVANRCEVISMSLGGQSPPQSAYTAAGQAALDVGCLIIAAAGNEAGATGAPANSPTIMSVASIDPNGAPSSFSNSGKIQIAGPGRDVFSAWPRPRRYSTSSGTSMATPHVAGCAALWAQSDPDLRGRKLWAKLEATAERLPFAPARVGAGLIRAP